MLNLLWKRQQKKMIPSTAEKIYCKLSIELTKIVQIVVIFIAKA